MENFTSEIGSVDPALTHRADFLRLDLVGDADFAWFPERVNWISQIFLREFVDMVVCTIFCDFDDLAADFQVAVGICGANPYIFLGSTGSFRPPHK
jgi:hypothetical protein